MSDKCMDRQRHTGVLLQTLLCWALIGLCCAGHRPRERGERPRYTRHHDRWTQRIQYPSVHDQGTQRIEYPSLNDEGTQGVHGRGQTVHYPSVNDSAASAQIQKCAPGYYRDASGPFLGRCVPCECNGLADECEDRTGRCLNCQYNTVGDRCERCKEGYYGNAAQGTCRVCPCPFGLPANSFAIGCKEIFGDFECICRAGYTGERCESCAPGYYGDPLIPGGSCQPCYCNGNSKNCDPRTGVCKNTLEPGDTNTDGHCQECDNCAQTLLNDLEKLDAELGRIKTLLDNATAGASSQDRLKKLEKALSDTKILVNKFNTAINTQKSRVNQLEDDMSTLADDISTLKDKADKRAADAERAVVEVGKTHKRAKDLESEIRNMLKKIQVLLDQLNEAGTSGENVTNENLAKMLEDAQRLVKEMEERNFTPQKTAAEKERDEAKKLLDYVKGNVSKQYDENEAKAEKLQDLLKDYEAKLKDLDKALKEAVDLLKKANAQNGLNAQAMVDLQKRIDDLKKERKTVEDQITMAENELQKTDDLVKMLSDSKTEYEQLAAQMDGAKTDLTKKVNDITKAAGKQGIVENAEKHAENLVKLAKQLEDVVKNASGRTEVRNAKDAIDAYKNITDAINAAKTAAEEAEGAADNALNNVKNQKLTERAKYLKDESDNLLNNAKGAETDLQDAKDDITDVKNRLNKADQKKKALQTDLRDAQNQLNGIKRDDIRDMIDEAKRKAALANDTAIDTMDKLNDIRADIGKININPVDSNLNNVLDDVDQSVKNLLKTIPSLNDKISEVENLTSQSSAINDISDNIKRLKELIEQARDAANRIGIPMKFGGTGHVEMHPPKDLEDLKAYTSMVLSLQRPQGRGDGRRKRRRRQSTGKENMFVLYLGNKDPSKNYIGMYLRENTLYGVYKLNGVEYEMKTGFITMSASEPAKFDRVELHRIYQDAKMALTKDITSPTPSVPIESNKQGNENKNLLDLNPSDVVFYVGGYPDSFTPPPSLNLPKYKGCIEFSSFNDKVTSLYNFQKAEGINPEIPCKRYVAPLDSDYYEGTGYGKVVIERAPNVLLIGMSILSRSENGLLLYMENEDNYFTVTMEQGNVFIRSNLLEAPVSGYVKKFPSSNLIDTLIVVSRSKFIVRMSSEDVAKADIAHDNKAFKEYYVGGAPLAMRERHNITIQPFKGCMKNMKQNNDFKPLAEHVGVSKGCPEKSLVSRKAELKLESQLSAELEGFSLENDVTVSLGFKSTENEGLILQDRKLADGISLALDNGHVTLNFNNKFWKSNKQYNDGQWHYLTITRRGDRIELLVDDEDKGQEQSVSANIPDTDGTMFLGKKLFDGCISNLYTRRPDNLYMAEDLSRFQASGDVLLDVCTADSLAQMMLDRSSKKR